ncbi:hypothetical protein A3Q33_02370 [Colwellia sp. PAMC 21821]|nr:hypothetical protein A3Q33_02370 [Colwellia sp. PAMC 21821]
MAKMTMPSRNCIVGRHLIFTIKNLTVQQRADRLNVVKPWMANNGVNIKKPAKSRFSYVYYQQYYMLG